MNNLSPFKEDTKSTAKYSRLCFARCPRSSNYTCVSKKHLYIFYFIIIIICTMSRKSCTCYLLKHFFTLLRNTRKRLKAKCLKNISVLKVHVIYAGCHFSKTYITCIKL